MLTLFFKRFSRVAVLALIVTAGASADVTLPSILAEHMVLQRGLPVHIWGKATPGEAVSVASRGETQSTTADTLGRWSVYLAPGECRRLCRPALRDAERLCPSDRWRTSYFLSPRGCASIRRAGSKAQPSTVGSVMTGASREARGFPHPAMRDGRAAEFVSKAVLARL
jgi:hypothetical protein